MRFALISLMVMKQTNENVPRMRQIHRQLVIWMGTPYHRRAFYAHLFRTMRSHF